MAKRKMVYVLVDAMAQIGWAHLEGHWDYCGCAFQGPSGRRAGTLRYRSESSSLSLSRWAKIAELLLWLSEAFSNA